jgi:hypothetical protein
MSEQISENGNLVTVAKLNQSTPYVIPNIVGVNNGEVGMKFISVVAADTNGNWMKGSVFIDYSKTAPADVNGVLTIDNQDVVKPIRRSANGTMAGCTFSIAKNSTTQNIDITLTGTSSAKLIAWKITIDPDCSVSVNDF